MINETLLKPEEKAVYALRSLYDRYGYTPYKMSKFEEYDLYAKNKDFLISEGIITFTDTKGKLLALKPDVTLSIIKNSKDADKNLSKLYYNENVYRIAKGSHVFKEIMQAGLECIGDIDAYHVAEVVSLAIRSLALLSDAYMLDLSHVGLIAAMIDTLSLEKPVLKQFLTAVEKKNAGELSSLAADGVLSSEALGLASVLLKEYKTLDAAKAALTAGKVVIFGSGLGIPFLSTDTTGAVRAAEIEADAMLMAKNVDYIYTADPRLDPNAKKLERVKASEVLALNLKAIDATATAFCLSTGMPIYVFGLKDPHDIVRAVTGESVGTVITAE